ncbi:MAG: hypothetical protein EOP84_14015 [Verrucomicrobiaceae bacterium]|nr:MAG: hypothetical protein EOP84_14015 [Verrucomicrobiaceae bacterium]
MKFGELKSIGHNIADSLASGIGLLIGSYEMDIFGEASTSREGYITVDFLTGTTEGGSPSKALAKAIVLYRDALEQLCQRHGVEVSTFKTMNARFGVDAVRGGHFTVTVEDQTGRRSVDRYVGMPGRRIRSRR